MNFSPQALLDVFLQNPEWAAVLAEHTNQPSTPGAVQNLGTLPSQGPPRTTPMSPEMTLAGWQQHPAQNPGGITPQQLQGQPRAPEPAIQPAQWTPQPKSLWQPAAAIAGSSMDPALLEVCTCHRFVRSVLEDNGKRHQVGDFWEKWVLTRKFFFQKIACLS
jgi:hypothetical protein